MNGPSWQVVFRLYKLSILTWPSASLWNWEAKSLYYIYVQGDHLVMVNWLSSGNCIPMDSAHWSRREWSAMMPVREAEWGWSVAIRCFDINFEWMTMTEKIQESSEAIVEAVAFLTGARDSRNSRALQPTVATKNVSVRIRCCCLTFC